MSAEGPAGPRRGAADEHADSAGILWQGRNLTGSGFEDDQGEADPDVLQAMRGAARAPGSEQEQALMTAVAGARWLVPIVAAPTDVLPGEGGLPTDHSTDLAVAVLEAPDGQRALPAFSSLEALARWDPQARPLPVTAARAAQAAVTEGCQVMVLDVRSELVVQLRPSQVWALAQQRAWLPAHEDPFVAASIARAVSPEGDVVRHTVTAGPRPGMGTLVVTLVLPEGLSQADVEALATRVGERLATDGEVRARIDELAFRLERA